MTQKSQSAIVYPAESLGGTLEVQGDKSISHRVAMLSALASGTSTVKHFLQSEDCVNTLRAMEALGARTFFSEDGELTIQGTGGKIHGAGRPPGFGQLRHRHAPSCRPDCGHADHGPISRATLRCARAR